MEPISIALGLAQILGPKVAGWFAGEKGEVVAEQVLGIAQAVTGIDDPLAAAEAIKANNALALEFKSQVSARAHELATLAFADRKDARAMYVKKHELADCVAKQIMARSLPAIVLLLLANVAVAVWVKDAAVAQVLGVTLGAALHAMWKERQTIIEFLFGGSLAADPQSPDTA